MKKNNYSTIVITIVIILLIVISIMYFSTINNGTDKNNIYYIFSTSAQTLAALVGFVLTAYIFTYQNLRSIKEDDETLTEIVEITIEKYYKLIFYLSSYTATVLIADILLLQLNMIEEWPFKSLVYISIAMANVSGIIIAFAIALYILRPFREKEWAISILNDKKNDNKNEEEKIKEEENLEKDENANETVVKDKTQKENKMGFTITVAPKEMIDTMSFIQKFIELEGLIRTYTDEVFQFNERISLRKRIDYLGATNKLPEGLIDELFVVIKYRNLAVHGHISEIERRYYDVLVKILDELKSNLKV